MTQNNGNETAALAEITKRQEAARAARPPAPQPIVESLRATLAMPVATNPERLARLREDEERRKKQAEAAMRDAAWKAAGVPARHADFKLADVEPASQWLSKLQSLVGMAGTGYLMALLGDRGTGKTQIAAATIRSHCDHAAKPSARYVRAMEFFMAVKESYRQDGPTEAEQIHKFASPALLVVDEAHERGGSEWENRLFTHLIDLRYAEGRDTILISNQKPEAFKVSVGESIYSRLVETGGVIVCEWPSFRTAGGGK